MKRSLLAQTLPGFLLDLGQKAGFHVASDGRPDDEGALHLRFEKKRRTRGTTVSIQVFPDGSLNVQYFDGPWQGRPYREGSYDKSGDLARVLVLLTENGDHVRSTSLVAEVPKQ